MAAECLFCAIAAGEAEASTVWSDDDFAAFLDVRPVNQGHILLVPREHYPTLADLPDEAAAETAALLPRLARAVVKATGADGLNLIVNNGRCAGQTIDHVHWHLIPRFGDDAVNWPWPHTPYVGDELGQMQFRIERELKPDADV